MVIVSDAAIDPVRSYELIKHELSGSVVLHYAVVKADGGQERPTSCIDYQSDGDTAAELAVIVAAMQEEFRLEDVLLIRRTGCLRVGEIISLVAASSPQSDEAFAACRYGISRLKKMTTIRKTERPGDEA